MRKFAAVLGIVLVALFVTACGNSPDGDSGRLTGTSSVPAL
jgi:hypothetical protein